MYTIYRIKGDNVILRKPYAILIKNFKLIHAILAILMGYLFYRTTNIVNFIGDYISSAQSTISNEVVTSLFNPVFVLIITVIIIVTGIIMALLKFKDKPIKIYAYNIIIYIASAVIYFFASSIIKQLEIGLVDIRTLKLVQDFVTALMIVQALSLIFVIVRATGFDIKNFNFKEDLIDLNIEKDDDEEFEVDLDVDTDKVKRRFRKKIRYTKYIYLENRLLVNTVTLLLSIIIVIFLIINLNTYNKTFKKQQSFKTNEFLINVTNSYLVNQDYKGKIINEDKQYVVVKIKINKLYGNNMKLKTGRITLNVGNYAYYHTSEPKDNFIDLGNTYLSNEITSDAKTYLLVFEIPNDIEYKKMILKYRDTNNRDIKVDVTPTNLKNKKELENVNIGETLSLEKSTLGNSNLIINSYEFSDKFKVEYKYCPNDNCYDSYEYITPTTTNNIEKTLLKIKGKLVLDENLGIRNISLPKFLQYFAQIKYIKGDVAKIVNVDFKEVKPKKVKLNNEYYVEVPKYILESEKIDLYINIRNNIYTYHLK